uniref:Uncharacterized protein n=1 Tax=Lactuca sativa TaxID=4236 RepID=A0A9R1VVH7_LACSA|nr:hypothetical protein LSAT_V11C400217450 [Lactuca sativa]
MITSLILNPRSTMASSSSSYSSKRQDEFQVDHPCDCDLPSHVKTSRTPDNPGRKFRVFQNSMDEGRTDGRYPYRRKLEESCNLTLKISTLENEINICRMMIEQENKTNMVNRHELDKVKWKLFTHKVALILLFVLYVKMLI